MLPDRPQRQDDTLAQVLDTQQAAFHHGLYEAGLWIDRNLWVSHRRAAELDSRRMFPDREPMPLEGAPEARSDLHLDMQVAALARLAVAYGCRDASDWILRSFDGGRLHPYFGTAGTSRRRTAGVLR